MLFGRMLVVLRLSQICSSQYLPGTYPCVQRQPILWSSHWTLLFHVVALWLIWFFKMVGYFFRVICMFISRRLIYRKNSLNWPTFTSVIDFQKPSLNTFKEKVKKLYLGQYVAWFHKWTKAYKGNSNFGFFPSVVFLF